MVSTAFFNQACGYTVQTDVRFTGLQAVSPSTRILRQSSRTDDASLVNTDVMTLQLLDKVKEQAITATPKIRPIRVTSKAGAGGRRDYNATLTDKYVVYLHPYQITDLRTSTSTGQWLDISKAAMTGGEITNNPIYTGAIGEYNSIIIRQAFDLPSGVTNAGAPMPNTIRGVMLGGQACMMAWGQKDSPGKYRWNEEMFDHKRRLEVSAWTIHGMKRTQYNGNDYGTIAISTWAQAHS